MDSVSGPSILSSDEVGLHVYLHLTFTAIYFLELFIMTQMKSANILTLLKSTVFS